MNHTRTHTATQLFRGALVLGMGLGAFIDGILLHQILGWHHLVCMTETCRPESIAMLQKQNMQDGLFNLAAWLVTIAGVVLTWKARDIPAEDEPSSHIVLGGAVSGWGVFNFVEGLINHQILGIHHVKPNSPHWLTYDLLFLGTALLLAVAGSFIACARHSTDRSVYQI